LLEEAKYHSQSLFEVSTKEAEELEDTFSSIGRAGSNKKKKATLTAEQRQERMDAIFKEQQELWKGKSLKQYALDNLKRKLEAEHESLAVLQYLGLSRMWDRAPRSQFMMDIWGAPGIVGLKADEVEAADLSFDPLDSTFFQADIHAAAVSQVEHVVRDALYEIFLSHGPEHYDEDAERLEAELELTGRSKEDPVPRTPPKGTYGVDLLEYSGMSSGIIKTGSSSFHQDLHIDNGDLLNKEVYERMVKDPHSVSPTEWLEAGYVIDLPLSKEGCWIRIAVPVRDDIVMTYVYIPFGSMGIRPMCLQHSGHYGSPGNTRFHATFYIRGKTEHNTKELGYLHKLLADKNGPFGKHVLQWSPEYYQQPMAPLKDPSKLVVLFKDGDKRSLGTNYWQMITKHKSDYICLLTYLLNPSDEKARAHARKLIFKRSVGSKKVALQPQRKRQRTQCPVLPCPKAMWPPQCCCQCYQCPKAMWPRQRCPKAMWQRQT
jgi:hypothetical protein